MLDLLIIAVFVAASVWAGWRARRAASRDLAEYFLAGRTLRGWQAGTSMAATQFAADTPLVVMGLVATAGIFALWQLWVYGLAFLLMAYLFSALWRRAGVLTDAELVELRYSGRGLLTLRVLKAFYYGTVINCVVLAMVLKATVTIAEVFLPWHRWLPEAVFSPLQALVGATGLGVASGLTGVDPAVAGTDNLISVVLILAFVSAYSLTGGLRGVVFTDVLQFALAMVGTIAYAVVAVSAAGGLDAVVERLGELYGAAQADRVLAFAPGRGDLLGPLLVVIGLQWLFQVNSDGTGYLAQRSMSCRTERDARQAGVLFAWLQIVLRSLPWLLIAAALLIVYPIPDGAAPLLKAQREFTFVRGIDDMLPSGVRGLLLVGMLAALASTLDTHLNWGASYWSNDLYQRLICRAWLRRGPGNRELVVIARLSNVLLILLALAIVPALGSIQQAWKLSLLFGAGAGSVLVLRWLWERVNLWSELAAIAASVVTAPLLLHLTGGRDDAEWLRLGVMALVSTAAAVGAALLGPPTSDEVLRRFYERVRPPGWWRRAARLAGDPEPPLPRLGRELVTTLVTATSLFCCLYGSARMLLPHPDTPGALAPAVLLIGILLVPWWWRRGFGRDRDGAAAAPSGSRS